ncbi:MarR family transcriptional regulator [Desulfovibrio aminophilus]|uniref:MarR family winged helix-turn-helix transcriptional regulator n=1 Tax=Desulfovibrio aminophilus TaxID=81425 RepID=UPI003395DF28
MLFVRDFPDQAMLLDISKRFSAMDPRALRASLALAVTHHDMLESFERFLGGYGLSQGRFLALMVMYRTPEQAVAPSFLARSIGVTRATMTGFLDGLERTGLLERHGDERDRRRKLVRLTTKGLELLRHVVPEYCRRTTRFATHLMPEEWATLHALLARLQDGVASFGQDSDSINV